MVFNLSALGYKIVDKGCSMNISKEFLMKKKSLRKEVKA